MLAGGAGPFSCPGSLSMFPVDQMYPDNSSVDVAPSGQVVVSMGTEVGREAYRYI